MGKWLLPCAENTDDSNSQKLNQGIKNTERGPQKGSLFIWVNLYLASINTTNYAAQIQTCFIEIIW